MKMTGAILGCLLILLAAGGITTHSAQRNPSRPNKEFMREKLRIAQDILEGLTTEDYNLIAAKAARLSAMSTRRDWPLFENPDYDQQNLAFKRHARALARTAREKNLDAATLAYVRVTMSCVDCHKLVRGKLIGNAPAPTPPTRPLALR